MKKPMFPQSPLLISEVPRPRPLPAMWALHVAHARIQLRVDEEQRRERRFGAGPAEVLEVATRPLDVLSATTGRGGEKNGV